MSERPASPKQQRLDLAARALVAGQQQALELLGQLGFRDPPGASRALDRLAGPAGNLIPLPALVLSGLAATPLPDRAILHLERFADAAATRDSLFRRLSESEALRDALLSLLGHSRFLTDILVRNPEHLYWLLEETPHLAESVPKRSLRADLRRDIEARSGHGHKMEALRRAQRRQLLRLGAGDLLGLKDVSQVGGELSDLADVILELALEVVLDGLVRQYGHPRDQRGAPARFTMVSLGKLGGRELNFSSDIDLLFVYDEDGQTRSRRGTGVDNNTFFNRLGERLIQALTEVTAEGFLYRVDMRLRPEGEPGPLVRSLRSHWIYYETRGELWERQMLIKARRSAGSQKLWRRFHQMLTPFVYPAHFAVNPHTAIRQIKERIEAEVQDRPEKGNNIKLCPGGIRDVEFTVQCLQLLSGRVDEAARVGGTLEAIDRLEGNGALKRGEAEGLRHAYRFLRRLENLLQIGEGRPLYAVPADVEERGALAACFGLGDVAEFDRVLDGHLSRARAIYEGVLYGDPGRDTMEWLLSDPPGSPRARTALANTGFADASAAHRLLGELSDPRTTTASGRRNLESCLDELLLSLGACPDPDRGLVRLVKIVGAYGAPGPFFQLMKSYPDFRRMLVTICGTSQFLSDLLQRDPGLLDGLVAIPDAVDDRALTGREDLSALSRHRNQQLLRIGTDDLLGLTTAPETFLRLSELAENVLRRVYDMARSRVAMRCGRPRDRQGREARFACIAAGKFGGQELTFGSDLDLFFVYEGEGLTGRGRHNVAFFTAVAHEVMRVLKEGDLYLVDARLRPEGRSAPVVIGLPSYRRYLQDRAAAWERLALCRARAVAGDRPLCTKVEGAIRGFVYSRPLDRETVAEFAAVRRRMEPRPQRGKERLIDIKRGPGGIVDIEFIAQILLLRFGGKHHRLRFSSTRGVLERLGECEFIPAQERASLLMYYDRFREVEKGMRMASDRPDTKLPTGAGELRALARTVGARDGRALEMEMKDLMAATRRIYKGTIADFSNSLPAPPATQGAAPGTDSREHY